MSTERSLFARLPTTATAPFCPPEVAGTVEVAARLPPWRKLLAFLGPGLLVAVGYMDPGNWATDLEAGSRYGYRLFFVVIAAGLAGMLLQTLCARLGTVAGRDLAQLCKAEYPRPVVIGLWLLAEAAIVACDVAEVLGAALALNLLLRIPLWIGVLLTAFDTLIVLGLKGRGFRQLETIILGLVSTIGLAFVVELFLLPPDLGAALRGAEPDLGILSDPHALYLALGVVGATIMPHNLYLHSSVVQTRASENTTEGRRQALNFTTLDTAVCLTLAIVVNGAILLMAASAFNGRGDAVTEIGEAYRLLTPIAGPAAALLFGIALLASGQSSTFTGTIAGQVI